MTQTLSIEQCPYCQNGETTVESRQGILVADCGHMLTSLEVRQFSDADKREVAEL